MPLSPGDLLDAQRAHGHVVFDDGPYDLNLIALRRKPGTLDSFDDLLAVVYRAKAGAPWTAEFFACTTDPGKPSIESPKRRDGTAVVALGQHRGAFTFGRHKGQYPCLVPTGPIPVVRYKSAEDYAAGKGVPSTSTGIQIHRASAVRTSTVVGPWSEGCVVLATATDLIRLLALCELQNANGLGAKFSLSVLEWPAHRWP
jgi:hypothetical protein